MRFSLSSIPAGEPGTDVTVGKLAKYVTESTRRPVMRLAAIRILNQAHVRNKDQAAAASALFNYVRRTIRYLPDPVDLETIQTPEFTMRVRAGDCDDHSALMAALAIAVGIPSRFRVVGRSPNNFVHIFPELFINGVWTPADTTEAAVIGQRPSRFPAEKVYTINGSQNAMSLGATSTVPLTIETIQAVAYRSTMKTLQGNWNAGRINLTDVESYLRVIDEGNSPSRGTVIEGAIRNAIVDFRDNVKAAGATSPKPAGSLSGLEGMDGFLKSVWNGVKKAVGTAVNVAAAVIPGGAAAKGILTTAVKAAGSLLKKKSEPIIEAAQQAYVENQYGVPVEAQKGIGDYLPWIIGGLVAVIVLPKVMKGR